MQASIRRDDNILYCSGEWTLSHLSTLDISQLSRELANVQEVHLNLSEVQRMDTAGALIFAKLQKLFSDKQVAVHLHDVHEQSALLIELISQRYRESVAEADEPFEGGLELLGKKTINCFAQAMSFLEFIGEAVTLVFAMVKYNIPIRLRAVIQTIYKTGYTALPIVGLLSFLIGIVLTYQMGLQLSKYGANIFIVDLLGLAILREFGPLLTAIIVAGRTASSFTSEISTMVQNQEIDALRTMGITPSDVVVIPKMIGLMITLPLLTIWANLWGVYGGIVMSHWYLNITLSDFLSHFQRYVPLNSFIVGLSKTPVFAVMISSVGCFQGMQVKGGAASVGQQTTKSVVQAIFLIIIADAVFSVIYSYLGI